MKTTTLKFLLFLLLGIAGSKTAGATDTYVKVTSSSDLVDGGVYIIAATKSSTTYIATAFDTNALTTTTSGFSVNGNTITVTTATPLEFTLGGNSSGYTLKYQSNNSDYYLGYANYTSSNQSSLIALTSPTDNKEKWTYNNNKLTSVANSSYYLGFNNEHFKCYTQTAPAANLYKKQIFSVTATSSNNSWGTVSVLGSVITAHPVSGYRVSTSTPYAVTSGTATVVQDGNTFTVTPSSNCSVQINFEAIPTHNVYWNVNGSVTSESVAEGSALTFNAPASGIPDGYTFVGWSSATLPTPQDAAPTYITSATMSTSDQTYYAVFAIATDGTETATLTAKSSSTSYSAKNFTDNQGNSWSGYCAGGERESKKLYAINGNLEPNSYIGSPTFTGRIKGIEIKAYHASNTYDRNFYFKPSKDSETTYGTVTVSTTENATNWLTVSLGNSNFTSFVITSDDAIFIYKVKVTYEVTTYTGFCTSTPVITLASACTDGTKYYGTYSSSCAFVVPGDLTVSEVKVAEGKLSVSNYVTGAVVPANTGVMVSSTTAGDHAITLSGEAGTSVLGSENMLKASGDGGITAEGMSTASSGCTYYRLTMHDGTTLGYYWGAASGVAFALSANKAYLAVPTSTARTSNYDMSDAEVTGITTIENSVKADGRTFNLNGQRVGADTKGIVIRNGRKYLNK